MLKNTLSNALTKQVNAELYSSYLYLAMSAYCDREGFKGFANWLHVQAQEEMAHAMHLYEYILDRGVCPQFLDIKAPKSDFGNMQLLFEQVLSHEQLITSLINEIATLALGESDHAAYGFIQWYINEQVEEEASAELILQKVKHIGENTAMLLTLDTEMGARVFVNPFPAAAGA